MLIIFDVEGTLCDGEFWDSFPETRGTAAAAMNGETTFRDAMAERFNAVKGMHAEQFYREGGRIVLRREAADAVRRLKGEGFTIALASGGFDFFTERIARELGAAAWTANKAIEEDGAITGHAEPLVDANAKRAFIEHLQAEFGFTRTETIVVGDGANDAEMMNAAGLSIAFNAKPVLENIAKIAVHGDLREVALKSVEYKKRIAGKPRVLVVGNINGKALEEKGFNVAPYANLPREGLKQLLPAFDALVYRGNEKLDAEILDAGKRLRLVARFGVGLDHIDTAHAEKRGIRVVNTPTASTESVAELALGLMLSLLRHIPQAHASTAGGEWRKDYFAGVELGGKTVGIVGVGRIGRAVARRLKAFGVNITGFDPFLHPEDFKELGVERKRSLEELLNEADIVTLHVPLKSDTEHLLDCRRIAMMKDGAFLINASRGRVVDTNALADALECGKLAGAALDVFEEEPLKSGRLHAMDNVIMTPHIGASTFEAQARIENEIASVLEGLEALHEPAGIPARALASL